MKAKVAIDKNPGFAVKDLHKDPESKLTITVNNITYTGILDVGVVPYGASGKTCARQLRLGVELKHTNDQKRRFEQTTPRGDVSNKI